MTDRRENGMKEIKRLPKPEFKEYLHAPPLDVPADYSAEKAFMKGVETKDWSDYQIAARKVCRLMLEAAKNRNVRRWLLTTQAIGDAAWNKLIITIGRETPNIARQINELHSSHQMLNWCVFSAAYMLRE